MQCITEVLFTKTVKGFFPSAFAFQKRGHCSSPLSLYRFFVHYTIFFIHYHDYMTVISTYMYNRKKKSLRHLVKVAKLLDDNKLSLKKWVCTVSTFIDVIQFHFNFKFPGVEIERTISKFRKRKRKFLCHVHILHNRCVKLGSFPLQSCNDSWKMYNKVWWTCKVIVFLCLLLFYWSRCCGRRHCLSSFNCCDPEILLPW